AEAEDACDRHDVLDALGRSEPELVADAGAEIRGEGLADDDAPAGHVEGPLHDPAPDVDDREEALRIDAADHDWHGGVAPRREAGASDRRARGRDAARAVDLRE